MKSLWFFLVAGLGLSLFSTVCRAEDAAANKEPTKEQAAPSQADGAAAMPDLKPDSVVATIGTEQIKLQDIDEEIKKKPNLAYYLQMAAGKPDLLIRVRRAALDGIINRRILLDAAKKSGKVDEAEVKKSVDKMLGDFANAQGGKDKFHESLTAIGTTPEKFASDIGDDFRLNFFIDKAVAPNLGATEEELKAAFDANPAKYGKPEQVHARHILIKTTGTDAAKDAEAKKRIDSIYEEVKKPGANFGEVAKAKSECPSAPKGGDLGFFGRGMMVPEFEQTAFQLKPGEMSAPIKTQFGYHIIKIEEHQEAQKPEFDKVKDTIKKEILVQKREEKVRTKIADLRKERSVQTTL